MEDKPIDDRLRSFLVEVIDQTGGDRSEQVSMYDVGRVLGLDKDQAGHAAEELIGMGLIEIRTLSGGIGITAEGKSQGQSLGQPSSQNQDQLGPGPIMNETDTTLVESLLLQIKSDLNKLGLTYEVMNELMADLRTVDNQLVSPKPKTAIIRACLNSISDALGTTASQQNLRGRVRGIVGDA